MMNVIRHIRARWIEVRADRVWRRYLDTRDTALRERAYALQDRAADIRSMIGARA